jgi:hypothetical protein
VVRGIERIGNKMYIPDRDSQAIVEVDLGDFSIKEISLPSSPYSVSRGKGGLLIGAEDGLYELVKGEVRPLVLADHVWQVAYNNFIALASGEGVLLYEPSALKLVKYFPVKGAYTLSLKDRLLVFGTERGEVFFEEL